MRPELGLTGESRRPQLAGERWRPQPAVELAPMPVSRRLVAFVIVVVIHALLALMLLTLAPEFAKMAASPKLFEAISINEPTPKPSEKPQQAAKAAPKSAAPVAKAPPVDVTDTPETRPFSVHLFEAIDITKLPNRRDELANADASVSEGNGRAGDSVAVSGPGGGPQGQTLYQAEWQREPTNAELNYYLPRGAPRNSWAVIACRTVERFRVDDCVAIGEGPPGSGMGEAIRQAAWQFRVLPPRINGKPQIGSWVRIRISFTEDPDASS